MAETNVCSKPYSSKTKWLVSIISGLLFLLIASPFAFSAVNSVTSYFGLTIASPGGVPNMAGLIVHAIVFTVIVRILMA